MAERTLLLGEQMLSIVQIDRELVREVEATRQSALASPGGDSEMDVPSVVLELSPSAAARSDPAAGRQVFAE
jgi:hypothetical protein